MEKGIMLSGEIRSVTARKEKDGRKVFAYAYQVEVMDSRGRVASYDVMDWGKEQQYQYGDLLKNVPVRCSVGNYGNVEFTIIKNNGSGPESDVPADLGKTKKPEVKI